MARPDLTRLPVDPFGLGASALAFALLIAQWSIVGDTPALVVWQAMVATGAAGGAIRVPVRVRVAAYVLAAIAALLYGLLSWAAGGYVDLLVTALLVAGAVRTILRALTPHRPSQP